jgi:hypothetical protein
MSGITSSMELSSYDPVGFGRLGGGRRNVFFSFLHISSESANN